MLATEPTLERSNKVSVKTDSKPPEPLNDRYKKLGQYGKLGGRPRAGTVRVEPIDKGQAFEKSSDQVAHVTIGLAEQVRELMRASKRGENVGQKLQQFSTSFGIWFDKLHKISAGQTGMDVDMNPKLAQSITSKVSGLQALTAKVALLSEECDRCKMLLQAADEGMIGP